MKNHLLRKLAISLFTLCLSGFSYSKITIAIDAGHGGKDPGAIGKGIGLKEKEVTLSIAKELKSLLDSDPNFKAVMTRAGDYFIQLPERTEIARRNQANYLISIHADYSPISDNMRGASVWVLSNRRANDELGKWLEDHEKQSELLGGAGAVLSSNRERYLNQTVLDLQFSHAQRSGYELGRNVLDKLSSVTTLVKNAPQHASLSVLRSPDIPSILVETGFLSNPTEEQKLASISYRKQIARAIYNGLLSYYQKSPNYSSPKVVYKENNLNKTEKSSKNVSKIETKQTKVEEKAKNSKVELAKTNEKKSVEAKEKVTSSKDKATKVVEKAEAMVNPNASYHIVQQDQTLYSIARMYNTTPEKLSQLNGIKENKIIVGKKLKLR